MASSIKEFGWRQPVVDAEGVVVCGHTRSLAARQLGLSDIPVHVAKDLTPAQAKADRLLDNKSHELSEWDMELLPLELHDLKEFDIELDGKAHRMQRLKMRRDQDSPPVRIWRYV